MKPDLSIQSISSVGPFFAKKLKKLGIHTVKDLIYHFPHRFENYTLSSDIKTVQPGEIVTVKGQIVSISNQYTRTGKVLQKAQVSDGESTIEVIWFNQRYLPKTLPQGTWVSLSGKVDLFSKRITLIAPEYEKTTNNSNLDTIHTGRLVPVYPETSGVSSKWIRAKIAKILPNVISEIEEFLPQEIIKENNLMELKKALKLIHFPQDQELAQDAKRRLSFDEFFKLQILALTRKKNWQEKQDAHKLSIDEEKILKFLDNLPFNLTASQTKSIKEIINDLQKGQPMNRLLEGDVGSGKTVVAAFACFVAYCNNFRSVLMSPTQILSSQHFLTLKSILLPLGVNIELITGGKKKSNKNLEADVLVGTHALLQKAISLENLALVVIDEQHRFGVTQRALLSQKNKQARPHVLTMTATPIPRTIALTMYGDLDLSTLDQMPKGRMAIKTWVVPKQKREAAYKWIRDRVKGTDEQAFIVCPIIEESEFDTMKSVRAASKEFERLSKEIFPDLRLALLHGKMKAEEKEDVMKKMKEGNVDVLVATPVVEVGIDIKNATIMMIEASERFGLAQLHQLRGRVGRGDKQSYCLLFTEIYSSKIFTRLKALEKNLSGRQLAEIDLKLRGPGEIYGTLQHGFPQLKIGSYSDVDLIKKARNAAEKILPNLDAYPQLQAYLDEKETIVPN